MTLLYATSGQSISSLTTAVVFAILVMAFLFQLMDAKQSAEYFVVAWCKDWSLMQYLRFTGVDVPEHMDAGAWTQFADKVLETRPWMPPYARTYARTVREFVGGAYPKLSSWLWSRASDVDRLKCANQLHKLKAKSAPMVRDQDREEMRKSSKAERQATASYRISRDAFKTNQRSAWNVCKA